jgi:hypothetical protein
MKPDPVTKPNRITAKAVITKMVVSSMKQGLPAIGIFLCFCYSGSAQVRFGDNLGNHRATDTLRMMGKPITGVSRISTDTLKTKIITDSLHVESNIVRLTAVINGGTVKDSLLVIDSTGLVKRFNMDGIGGGSADLDTFTSNLTVHGTSFGKYTDGQIIPSQGKTAKQVIADAIVLTVPPAYIVPTVSLTSSPSTSVEIGSTINVSLTATYNKNDGGTVLSTLYKKNGSALAGNTDNNVILISPVTYQAAVSYDQGACKDNNLGVQDCTGQISAGTVASNIITYTPSFKRYAGWLSDTTGITQTGSGLDVLIRGLSLINELSSSKTFSFDTSPATGKFLVFCYVQTSGAFSNLTINGVGSLGAFNTISRSFTNAQGYAYNVLLYWNTQAQTTTGYAIATN